MNLKNRVLKSDPEAFSLVLTLKPIYGPESLPVLGYCTVSKSAK